MRVVVDTGWRQVAKLAPAHGPGGVSMCVIVALCAAPPARAPKLTWLRPSTTAERAPQLKGRHFGDRKHLI